jgi:hypothetical protein
MNRTLIRTDCAASIHRWPRRLELDRLAGRRRDVGDRGHVVVDRRDLKQRVVVLADAVERQCPVAGRLVGVADAVAVGIDDDAVEPLDVGRPAQRAISDGVLVPPSSLDQIIVYSIVRLPWASAEDVWQAMIGTSVFTFSNAPGIVGRLRP